MTDDTQKNVRQLLDELGFEPTGFIDDQVRAALKELAAQRLLGATEPPFSTTPEEIAFQRLSRSIAAAMLVELRANGHKGVSWPDSPLLELLGHLKEEAVEFVAAVASGDTDAMREEGADVCNMVAMILDNMDALDVV